VRRNVAAEPEGQDDEVGRRRDEEGRATGIDDLDCREEVEGQQGGHGGEGDRGDSGAKPAGRDRDCDDDHEHEIDRGGLDHDYAEQAERQQHGSVETNYGQSDDYEKCCPGSDFQAQWRLDTREEEAERNGEAGSGEPTPQQLWRAPRRHGAAREEGGPGHEASWLSKGTR
jgi:hypothetical protein